MIKMGTDLLYTQLQAIDGYTIVDKRNETYTSQVKSANTIFFATIKEEESGKWNCTFNAFKNDAAFSSTKEYDSFYKILMDAKNSLENFMQNLSGNIVLPANEEAQTEEPAEQAEKPFEQKTQNPVMDNLAGTWTGEEYIEKILILRGGRGFIVYKNGASMNISVSADGDLILIKQKGKPNASFYPELPRQEALKIAAEAKPIEWTLTLAGQTLTGTKKTLVADRKSSTGVSEGTVTVTWTKLH
ncbi:MAG: hypothetical protein SPJ89_00030 [Treponema sp.]|nr:hypothetical protein [Spirochaetia bacterium]MDD7459398.1 hypothetical protein [Spirochaetales bacterium]MDY5810352.1 hypothetical protein [Treponema sp.]